MGSSRKRGGRGLWAVLLAILLTAATPLNVYASTLAPFPGAVNIVPQSVAGVGGCIPFGATTWGFAGFIYRDVPPFKVEPGTRFAFDLGHENDVDVRRNIYFAEASINPSPGDRGIRALEWIRVVSDSQVPENPRGNTVVGDYELVYSAENSFDFPGGGFIVGVGASPPGEYRDATCRQVLVHTRQSDPSGHFFARFWQKADQTTSDLDTGSWGTDFLAGIVIFAEAAAPSVKVVRAQLMSDARGAQLLGSRAGVVPVAILSEDDFDAPGAVDQSSLRFGATGSEESLRHCVAAARDVDRDGLADLVCHFDVGAAGLEAGAGSAVVTGTAGGMAFEGAVTFRSPGRS